MISNAWAWSDQQAGRKRKNEVHGEEEIRIVLNDTFEFIDEEAEQLMQQGAFDMEDCFYIQAKLPQPNTKNSKP